MKTTTASALLADDAPPPAPATHQPNDKGIFETPEKIFVPVGVGNTCAFYLAHIGEGAWCYGWDFWTRSPKNHSTQLPSLAGGLFTSGTREEALRQLVAGALVWFGDHRAIVARIEAWRDEHLPAAASAAQGVPAEGVSPTAPVAPGAENNGPAGAAAGTVEDAPVGSTATHAAEPEPASAGSAASPCPTARHAEIPVADILVESNPRRERDPAAQRELVEALRTQPLLHPIVLRDLGGPERPLRYELIAGHGRLLAYRELGRATIEARIFAGVDRATALSWALVENLQRSDLNAMDEAEGYQQLNALGWTQARIARETGKGLRTIEAALVLTKLPDEGRAALRAGKLSAYQAREIAARWHARPEHCRVLVAATLAEAIPGSDLACELPHRAIPALEQAKLIVRLPFGYADHPEVGTGDPYVRFGATTYCLDLAAWKQAKKAIDVRLRAEREAAEAKAAAKIERAQQASVSLPLADLQKAHVDVVRLAGEREIYAEHLPAEFVATSIDASKVEVLVCLRPGELRRIEEAWQVSLADDRTRVAAEARARALERIRKLKKVGPREAAALAWQLLAYCEVTSPRVEDFKAAGLRPLKGDFVAREAWARLDVLSQVKLLLVMLVRAGEGLVPDFDLLRWLLDTPKLGLLEEDPKRRDAELARLAAQLWPSGAVAFTWSDQGIAQNPERYTVPMPRSKDAHCQLTLAQAKAGTWHFGWDMSVSGEGVGCNPWSDRDPHDTKWAAFMGAITHAKAWFSKAIGVEREAKKFVDALQAYAEQASAGGLKPDAHEADDRPAAKKPAAKKPAKKGGRK